MNLKKPKFWDQNKPNILSYILFPIAYLIQFRGFFLKLSKPKKFQIKTICLGNIYVGGTGKTSLSIAINKILTQKKIKSCFVKKFYENQDDEQKLLKSNGKLFLSDKRADALNRAEIENYEIAILDDGLQDKTINYDLSFVCFNDVNWIGNGMTIPAGPLRENINNLKNFKHVFLNGNLENIDSLKKQINKLNPNISIHLGKYEPTNIVEFEKSEKYLIFSGIGNHNTFVSMVKKNGLVVLKDLEFPDHYSYTKKDINNILNEANKLNCSVITTEKDFQKINILSDNKIKIMKIDLKIIDEDKFINSIMQ